LSLLSLLSIRRVVRFALFFHAKPATKNNAKDAGDYPEGVT
jgi:hypothetical protein